MSDIYLRTPVSGTAAIVTSQNGCSEEDLGVMPYELNEQRKNMLKTRRKDIADYLGIITKRQQSNYMYKINTRTNYINAHTHSELLQEWYNIGKESARITMHLNRIKLDKQ